MVFFVEASTGGSRVVAVYPDEDLMRTYADLPAIDGFNGPFHIAFDQVTRGVILGSNYGTPSQPPLSIRGGRRPGSTSCASRRPAVRSCGAWCTCADRFPALLVTGAAS